MTYLTQAILDFATAARLRLRDSYDWHQAVWKAFPGRDGKRRDFLSRLDPHAGWVSAPDRVARRACAARLVPGRPTKLDDQADS